MRTAYLFPGQGSQYVGMGQDLYDRFDQARQRIDEACEVLGYDIREVMFGSVAAAANDESGDGDDSNDAAEVLRRTNYTQPALYVHSMAAWEVLKSSGVDPACTAGHSLGEYSALAAAGAVSFQDGLRVVQRRGELMAGADRVTKGAMTAVLGLDDDVVGAICDRVERETGGVVRPANYNAPGQIVVSGELEAVEAAGALAGEAGARKVVPLPVGGAFHSPLMTYAAKGLSEALHDLTLTKPECPVFLNVTAEPVTEPEKIRAMLLEQLVSPVRWSQSVTAMHESGVTSYVEVGAGKVLSGLVKRILGRRTETSQVGTVADLVG